ncbi:MAG: HdeD family acid-resistance protein [Roseiarcus sp.]
MTFSDSSLTEMQSAVRKAIGLHWRIFLFHGVALIVLGVIAVIAPVLATFAVEIFVGWLFLIGGVVGLVAMFSSHDVPAFLWSLLTAALSVVLGALLIWRPITGVLSLTIALTAFFIVEGVFQSVTSIAYHRAMPGAWGWMLASGVADLVLAALIIVGLPFSAAWALGLVVGVNLISSGVAITMVAFAGRDLSKAVGGD